jgi:hypothetical protein
MYLCAKGIDFCFFLRFFFGGRGFWKCSDSVLHYSILFLDYCVFEPPLRGHLSNKAKCDLLIQV